MTIETYFKYALANKLPLKFSWLVQLFSLPLDSYPENSYLRRIDNKIYVKINDAEVLLENVSMDKPIIDIHQDITLTKDDLINVPVEGVKTKIRKALINYVLLVNNFGAVIPYINGKIDVGKIEEEYIVPRLRSTKEYKDENNDISIEDYKSFVNTGAYIRTWSSLFVYSATLKAIVPPDGIIAYRDSVVNEMVAEFGPNVFADVNNIITLETKLKAFADEYYKDDPSYGVMLSGKITNISLKKLFLTIGAETAFNQSAVPTFIIESLLEGWSLDPDKLTALYNSSRDGSYSRGAETFKGGLVAKQLLRATSGIIVKNGDCGTELGKVFTVTPDTAEMLIDRHIVINPGEFEIIKDAAQAKTFLGKQITVRSPMYCKEGEGNFCAACTSEYLSNVPTGISILISGEGGKVLNASMKKMHGTGLDTVRIDLNEIII